MLEWSESALKRRQSLTWALEDAWELSRLRVAAGELLWVENERISSRELEIRV